MTPGDWVVSVLRVLSSCGWSDAVNAQSQQQEVESHFQAQLTQMPLQVAFSGRCGRSHLSLGSIRVTPGLHQPFCFLLQLCHPGFSDRDVFC